MYFNAWTSCSDLGVPMSVMVGGEAMSAMLALRGDVGATHGNKAGNDTVLELYAADGTTLLTWNDPAYPCCKRQKPPWPRPSATGK